MPVRTKSAPTRIQPQRSTAAAVPPASGGDPISIESLYRISVKQYHAMSRAAILTEEDPVELLEGLLVCKMSKNPPHVVATDLLQRALSRVLPDGWYVSMQNPLTTKTSEPEPDAKVVRGDPRNYVKRKPGPRHVPLAVEVADKSLKRDRTVKKRIYADASIPTYWIVNLIDRCVEVYTDPTGPITGGNASADYRQVRVFGPDEEVAVVLRGRVAGRIPVRDLLP
jgi:Uma2 family endonuclease